jgi:PAS domain S-box-containing protein
VDERGERLQSDLASVAPSDRLLRAVIELSDDAVVTCDHDGTVTFMSDTATRMVGRGPQEVVGRPLSIMFPQHLRSELQSVVATAVAGELIRHFETEILRPDGLPVPVSLSLAPVSDAHGTVLGCVVVGRDVTEQHLAQATMAEIDARLEEGEALTHVGSWLWDFRTDAVQWSAEFHRIHDIDPLDFPGTFDSFIGCISDADSARVRAALIESVQASQGLELDYRVVHADGKTHTVRIRATPILGSDGSAVGLRGIGQDVTDEARPFSG